MKGTWYKIRFGFIKNIFIGLLTAIVNASNHTKWVSKSSQKCPTEPTLFNLHPNEYAPWLRYYSFAVNLGRCVGICNTLDDLSNRVCVSNKTEYLNENVFNIVTGLNESEILTKHISYECECKFHGTKSNSNLTWNNNKCRCECKNIGWKILYWIPSTCSCKNDLASIIDDSVITCEEIIKTTKTVPTNFTEKEVTRRIKNFYILSAFLLHLLPHHVSNNKLKEVLY